MGAIVDKFCFNTWAGMLSELEILCGLVLDKSLKISGIVMVTSAMNPGIYS